MQAAPGGRSAGCLRPRRRHDRRSRAGILKDFQEVEKVIRLTGNEFTPNPDFRELYDRAYANFKSLYPPFSAIGKGQIA